VVTTTSTPWGFRCQLLRAHDGDSFWVLADLGFSCRAEVELRLDGVHAPELNQPGGHETAEFANGWLTANTDPVAGRTWPLWISVARTVTAEPGMRQSFTRYVATVWAFNRRDPSQSLNESLNQFLAGHPAWPTGF
jgi:endonuclease YncB( thermonuclease family)